MNGIKTVLVVMQTSTQSKDPTKHWSKYVSVCWDAQRPGMDDDLFFAIEGDRKTALDAKVMELSVFRNLTKNSHPGIYSEVIKALRRAKKQTVRKTSSQIMTGSELLAKLKSSAVETKKNKLPRRVQQVLTHINI